MPNKTATKHPTETDHTKRLDALRRETEELEKKIALARGTRDLPHPAVESTLEQRLESALRARPRAVSELARELGESSGKIVAALKPMRRRLYNAGTEDAPAWFWIVGDAAPAADVNAAIAALVRFKPMRFPELLAATDARQGRVSGAIVALQRDPKCRLLNLDVATRARWFLVPEGVPLAKLRAR